MTTTAREALARLHPKYVGRLRQACQDPDHAYTGCPWWYSPRAFIWLQRHGLVRFQDPIGCTQYPRAVATPLGLEVIGLLPPDPEAGYFHRRTVAARKKRQERRGIQIGAAP